MGERESELIEWLRCRALLCGKYVYSQTRDWGVSSNAMIEYALGGKLPERGEYPSDADDMIACERACKNAPRDEVLNRRMTQVLEMYRRAMAGGES